MLGIVIIAYNEPEFIRMQIEQISRLCTDEFQIVVVDNSTNPEAAEAIKFYCKDIKYIKTNASSKFGSSSHAFSANLSFLQLNGKFDRFLYLDHDCFPVKKFSVDHILGDKVMGGIGQEKGKLYLWPGCLMWDASKVDPLLINFSPNGEFGLDTGGELYQVIDTYGKENILFMNEEYCENPEFVTPPYNFYSMICNGTFMHFINGSNWNRAIMQRERINSLKNIMKQITE